MKKLLKVAKERELLYAEIQDQMIQQQRKAIIITPSEQTTRKQVKQLKTVNAVFNSFSHTKPKTYKALHEKTLSQNHILGISDLNPDSPSMLLPIALRTSIASSKGPKFDNKDLGHVMKYIKNMKTTKRGLLLTLDQAKRATAKDQDTSTAASILKFLIKKHLKQPYLFEKEIVKSYSECDYVVKFWAPLIEKAFKQTSIIPHWGDTISSSLLSIGVKMKMDLRLVAVNHARALEDHGYGEVAKVCSAPKYFKDKRKCVVASKALLNTTLKQNSTQAKVEDDDDGEDDDGSEEEEEKEDEKDE